MDARRPVDDARPLLLLALESSGRIPSVALLRGEELLGERHGARERPGAESLLPAVDELLAQAGKRAADLEAFAVSIGPGSFTGLRVGIATVKGLAFGSGRPVAAVSSLAALARGAPESGEPVVALLDARRDEFYAASFRISGPDRAVASDALEEAVYTPAELIERLPSRCLLLGEGVALCGSRLCAELGAGVRLGPAADPRARDVGTLGARLLGRGAGVGAADLVPRYLRRAEAEVRRTGRRFEKAPQAG